MENVIGRTVIVYDRYHFALPLKGVVIDVAEKDGAYQIRLLENQHGYPNYMNMSKTYFFAQQCRFVSIKQEKEMQLETVESRITKVESKIEGIFNILDSLSDLMHSLLKEGNT